MFFWAHPKDSSFELKSPTNMTLSERLLMVWKSGELGFKFHHAKISLSSCFTKADYFYEMLQTEIKIFHSAVITLKALQMRYGSYV